MQDLYRVSDLVRFYLTVDHKTRNDDNYLYFVICRDRLREKGVDISDISFMDGLLMRQELDIPPFESVRRTRQKLQEKYPEFSADGVVSKARAKKEKEYRKFAKHG